MYKDAPKKMSREPSMSDAMKMTRGVARPGVSSNGYGLKDVKMPFGGNVSADCGKALPKAEKGLC